MEEHSVRKADEKPADGGEKRAWRSGADVGERRDLHRRRRCGERVLEGRGENEREVQGGKRERRDGVLDGRPGTVRSGREHRVTGKERRSGEGAGVQGGVGGGRERADEGERDKGRGGSDGRRER